VFHYLFKTKCKVRITIEAKLITFTANYCSIALAIMTSRDKLASMDILPNNKDQTNETPYSFLF